MILTVTLNAAIDKRYVVEEFQVGEVNRMKACAYTPGGKGLNVSKPAAIAGARVVATGFVGGHAGDYITESLKDFPGRRAHSTVWTRRAAPASISGMKRTRCRRSFWKPGFQVTEEEFAGFLEHFSGLVADAERGNHVRKRAKGAEKRYLSASDQDCKGCRKKGDS